MSGGWLGLVGGKGCRKGAEWAGSWDIQEVVSGVHVGQKPGRSNGDLRVGWRARGGGWLGGEVEGGGRDASSDQRHPASSVHIGHIQFILHWSLSRSGTSTMMALTFIMALLPQIRNLSREEEERESEKYITY